MDFGEVCERDTEKECSAIDPGSYVDGVAKCNDSCSGWIVSDCVSVGCETAVDNPDDAFADTNCDGIDGDASASVFVDKLNGLNTNPGTKDLPVATIMKALEIAQEQDKKHILVGTGAGRKRGLLLAFASQADQLVVVMKLRTLKMLRLSS